MFGAGECQNRVASFVAHLIAEDEVIYLLKWQYCSKESTIVSGTHFPLISFNFWLILVSKGEYAPRHCVWFGSCRPTPFLLRVILTLQFNGEVIVLSMNGYFEWTSSEHSKNMRSSYLQKEKGGFSSCLHWEQYACQVQPLLGYRNWEQSEWFVSAVKLQIIFLFLIHWIHRNIPRHRVQRRCGNIPFKVKCLITTKDKNM